MHSSFQRCILYLYVLLKYLKPWGGTRINFRFISYLNVYFLSSFIRVPCVRDIFVAKIYIYSLLFALTFIRFYILAVTVSMQSSSLRSGTTRISLNLSLTRCNKNNYKYAYSQSGNRIIHTVGIHLHRNDCLIKNEKK